MSLTAEFYNFSKRRNSTKQPTGTGTQYSIVLKQPTSMNSPTFVLEAASFSFNYCKFNNEYFFVSDIRSIRNNIWEVDCSKDVMATYKSAILATSAYVLYDNIGNSEIVDSRLAIETSRSIAENHVLFPDIVSGGVYVLTAVGERSCDSWWNVDPNDIQTSIIFSEAYTANAVAFTPSQWYGGAAQAVAEGLGYLGESFTKAISYLLTNGNALDAIRNCIWLPIKPIVSTSGTPLRLHLGTYDTALDYYKITDPLVQLTQVSVNIPWQVNDWRRNSPYTQVYLYIPFIGVVSLPSSQLTGESAITLVSSLNVVSGDLCVNVNNSQQILGSYGANIAMNIPIGSSNTVQRQTANTIVQTGMGLAGLATGLGIGAGAAALSGVASAAASQISGVPTCVGGLSNGAASGLSKNVICYTVLHDTTVTPSSVQNVIGLPSFQKRTISSISGYCQCQEFSLGAIAPEQDIIAVNNIMNTGAFIE